MKASITSSRMNVKFGNKNTKASIGNIQRVPLEGKYTIYRGEYLVTPLAFQEQQLETKDKILEENIKVKEIPYFETSNQYGNTVYIGSEVN